MWGVWVGSWTHPVVTNYPHSKCLLYDPYLLNYFFLTDQLYWGLTYITYNQIVFKSRSQWFFIKFAELCNSYHCALLEWFPTRKRSIPMPVCCHPQATNAPDSHWSSLCLDISHKLRLFSFELLWHFTIVHHLCPFPSHIFHLAWDLLRSPIVLCVCIRRSFCRLVNSVPL